VLSVLFQLKIYSEKYSVVPDPYSYQWDPKPGATFPRTYPQVYKNAMELGQCRDSKDACLSYWSDRLVNFFGDREVDVIDGHKIVNEVNDTFGAFPEEFLTRSTLKQYLTKERFQGSDLKFGTGIGTSD
jgi:hypothetical protein